MILVDCNGKEHDTSDLSFNLEELKKQQLFPDDYEGWKRAFPEKFVDE